MRTYELCPYCQHEGEFPAVKTIQKCPNCGAFIVICSMCDTCVAPCDLEEEAFARNGYR